MKMKRLLVYLSLLAVAHMVVLATGSTAWDEILKEPSNGNRSYSAAFLFIGTSIWTYRIYKFLFAKTRKKNE